MCLEGLSGEAGRGGDAVEGSSCGSNSSPKRGIHKHPRPWRAGARRRRRRDQCGAAGRLDRERAALAELGVDGDPAVVPVHDPLHDREAEAGARLGEGLGVGGPEELAEQLVLVLGGDADALVVRTANITRSPIRSSVTVMERPGGVYLTALLIRLAQIRSSSSWSPSASTGSSGATTRIASSLLRAETALTSSTSSRTARRSTGTATTGVVGVVDPGEQEQVVDDAAQPPARRGPWRRWS